MATQEAPHIGHLIKEELARQERTVAWLARKLCCSRQNVYHLFECQWISTEILTRLCDIMDSIQTIGKTKNRKIIFDTFVKQFVAQVTNNLLCCNLLVFSWYSYFCELIIN